MRCARRLDDRLFNHIRAKREGSRCLFNVVRNYFPISGNDLALGVMEVENILMRLHFLTAPRPPTWSSTTVPFTLYAPLPPDEYLCPPVSTLQSQAISARQNRVQDGGLRLGLAGLWLLCWANITLSYWERARKLLSLGGRKRMGVRSGPQRVLPSRAQSSSFTWDLERIWNRLSNPPCVSLPPCVVSAAGFPSPPRLRFTLLWNYLESLHLDADPRPSLQTLKPSTEKSALSFNRLYFKWEPCNLF